MFVRLLWQPAAIRLNRRLRPLLATLSMAMERWSNGADVALAMAMALTVCELCANLNKFEVCFCLRSLLVRASRNICEHLPFPFYFTVLATRNLVLGSASIVISHRIFQYYLNSTTRAQIIIVVA